MSSSGSSLSAASGRYRQRKLVDRMVTVLAYICTVAAIVPLTWIILYVIYRGLGAWDVGFFTDLPSSSATAVASGTVSWGRS